jgi:hypothetical protein
MIDLVVELDAASELTTKEVHSRIDRIKALKEHFSQNLTPVAEAIQQAGGAVIESAWLNSTVLARVPTNSIPALAAHEKIMRLDVPHPVTPEKS